jgi:hypothetical protein
MGSKHANEALTAPDRSRLNEQSKKDKDMDRDETQSARERPMRVRPLYLSVSDGRRPENAPSD